MPSRFAVRAIPLLMFAALLAATGDAAAQRTREKARESSRDLVDRTPRERAQHNRQAERNADHRALSEAVRRVERRTGGQVLSAERVPFDGRDINRIKVVDTDGRVRVYLDDPSGRSAIGGVRTRHDDN